MGSKSKIKAAPPVPSIKKLPAKKKGDKIKNSRVRAKVEASTTDMPKEVVATPMPASLEPMQATRIEKPFNDPRFIYEVKWDGYRIIARVSKGSVKLFSRSGLDYTSRYPVIAKALSTLTYDAIIDGEVIVLDGEGKPDFDALQRYREGDPIVYYTFDLLWLEGYSMLRVSLLHRRRMLARIITNNEHIRLSESFDDGLALYNRVKELDLEGIVAKEKNSVYQPGKRVTEWYKIPTEIRQEFVIGGWTESGSGRAFRSLLFGYYENGHLLYAGHAGGGFKEKEMPSILKKLKKLEIRKKPFSGEVETDTTTHWVKPELVAEIKYATLTEGGKIRKPAIFLGFREDKPARAVKREVIIPKDDELKQGNSQPPSDLKKSTAEGSNWPRVERHKITSKNTVEIEGEELVLTNLEQELWRGVTKADLIAYYHRISPYILPHLKNRPLSLHLKPDGPHAEGFYIKDMEGRQPSFAQVFSTQRKHSKKDMRDRIDYLICNNEATLLYLVNLGCIDINPWSSTSDKPLQPDYISIDLDPTVKNLPGLVQSTKTAKKVLDQYGLTALPKTSGKTGIHIYIPCEGFSFAEARVLATRLCNEIHLLIPSITTTETSIRNRGDKIYLDPNQNDEADTLAAPYSVRPHYIPGVSTPIEWKELNEDFDPSAFTIHTIPDRVEKKGEIFKRIFNKSFIRSNTRILRSILP